MRIILLQNVDGVGQKDDVKNVKPGFWRNFLMPQNLAVEATPRLLEEIEKKKKTREEQKEYEKKQLEDILKRLKKETLIIERKADEKGSLFDGIDAKELAELIKEKSRFEIPSDFIKLEKPIKKIGSYEVPVSARGGSASGGKDVTLKLEIKPAQH